MDQDSLGIFISVKVATKSPNPWSSDFGMPRHRAPTDGLPGRITSPGGSKRAWKALLMQTTQNKELKREEE